MTDDELRRLLAEVTPGPWEMFINDSGDQWSGWPLCIDATSITDKVVVRPGGQWPYEWDAKTSQHEAVSNARLIAAAPELAAEVLRLREALEVFASAENWKQGGPCDPNSPSFVGIGVARAALNPEAE